MKGEQTAPHYRIELSASLDPARADWLGDLALTVERRPEGPVTVLDGPLTDQAALMGLLRRLHGLGLTLLLVRRL